MLGFENLERLGGPRDHAEGRGAACRCDREPDPLVAGNFSSRTMLQMSSETLHVPPGRSTVLAPNHTTPGDDRGGTSP